MTSTVFSSRLCWTKCLENYSCKAIRLVKTMRSLFNKYEIISPNIAFRIFDVKIKPMIMYGSEVWGVGYFSSIENIQIQFCKAFLCLEK